MKTNLLFALLLLFSTNLLFSQTQKKNLVVGPVVSSEKDRIDERITHTVRIAANSAFKYCNCTNIGVQVDHRYKGKKLEEVMDLANEVENIIVMRYRQKESLEHSPEDEKKLKKFKEKIQTDYLFFGYLSFDPRIAEQEYGLEAHLLDINTWQTAFPTAVIYFSRQEIVDFQEVRKKLITYYHQNRQEINCIEKDTTPYWASRSEMFANPEEASRKFSELEKSVNPSVNNAPAKTNKSGSTKKSVEKPTKPKSKVEPPGAVPQPAVARVPSMDDLDQVVRQLILAELYYPASSKLRHAREDYTDSPIRLEHYLKQKLLVYGDLFGDLLRRRTQPANENLRLYARVMVETIDTLKPMIKESAQVGLLDKMRLQYQPFSDRR